MNLSSQRKMNYKYFVHRDCAFFPCHDLAEWRSCLFCWCPLYLLDCGGDFTFKDGIKDCSNCTIPHAEDGYDYVLQIISGMRQDIMEILALKGGNAI